METLCAVLLLIGTCSVLAQNQCDSHQDCVPYFQCGLGILDLRVRPRATCSHPDYPDVPSICCDIPGAPQQIENTAAGQCGVRNTGQSNIAHNEAQFGEFPWHAVIFFSNFTFKCGASIIGDRWLLTAAHCVNGFQPYDFKVRLGEWQVNTFDEPKPYLDVDVSAISIHPQFNPRNVHNDIAVLQLAQPVEFQYHINSICLPSLGQTFWGQRCIATGWGKDSFTGNYQHILKKVELPIVEHQQCQSYLRKTRLNQYFNLHDSFMCAGGEVNKDSCKGDGGGPLACQDPVTGRYILTGITAWGIGCGDKDVPGVYADVQALLPFVQSVIGSQQNKPIQAGAAIVPETNPEDLLTRIPQRRPGTVNTPQVNKPTQETTPEGPSIRIGQRRPGTVITPQVNKPTQGTCGNSVTFDERIANGSPTIQGQYPWMVHLSYFSSFHREPVSCGGTLVSKIWVLTAAHCFRFLDSNRNVIVLIGFTDKTHQVPGASVFSITRSNIITHGGFTNETLSHDIAIVRLPEEVTLSNIIQPICIGTNQQIPFGGKATASGWGLLSPDGDAPNILHDVQLDILPDGSPSCGDSKQFICTYTPGKDTCRGDSGGPLMVKEGNQWFQVGIVSSGPLDCGTSKDPSSYTRVPNYMKFITSNIRL